MQVQLISSLVSHRTSWYKITLVLGCRHRFFSTHIILNTYQAKFWFVLINNKIIGDLIHQVIKTRLRVSIKHVNVGKKSTK